MNEVEQLVFYLCEGDLTKRNEVMPLAVATSLEYYYLKRIKQLNELEQTKRQMEKTLKEMRKNGK